MIKSFKCPNCGGALEIPERGDKIKCPYCDSILYLQDIKSEKKDESFLISGGYLEKYKGTDEIVTIPDDVNIIGPKAFTDNRWIKEVIIPSSVREIEGVQEELPDTYPSFGAFAGCEKLEKVTFMEGTEVIGKRGFCECGSLKTVILPNSLKKISHRAFYCCPQLEEVKLPHGLNTIGQRAFSACASLKKMEIPGTVRYIHPLAFAESENLSEVTFNEGLEIIDYGAFYDTGLEEVILPESLKKLRHLSFGSCPLKKAALPKEKISMAAFSERLDSYEAPFMDCANLSEVINGNINNNGFENTPYGKILSEERLRKKLCPHCGKPLEEKRELIIFKKLVCPACHWEEE